MLRRDFLFGVVGSAAAVPACLADLRPSDDALVGGQLPDGQLPEPNERNLVARVIPPAGWTPSGLCDMPPGESVITDVIRCGSRSEARELVVDRNRLARKKYDCRPWHVEVRKIGRPIPRGVPEVTFSRKQRAWVAVATCMAEGVDGVGPISRRLKMERTDVWVARRKFRILGLTADDFRALQQRTPEEEERCREVVLLVLNTQKAQRRESKRRSKLARLARANGGIA